ncbi:hypothetical protein KKG61_06020 [bacterium]|nr:hypothetical protein [bacterium]
MKEGFLKAQELVYESSKMVGVASIEYLINCLIFMLESCGRLYQEGLLP